MQQLRAAIGVGLAISLTIIVILGFFATSSRDLMMVFAGFAFGLVTVYLVEQAKTVRAR